MLRFKILKPSSRAARVFVFAGDLHTAPRREDRDDGRNLLSGR